MSGDIAPLIRNLCTTWRWVVSITPRPPCPGESSRGTQRIGGQIGSRVGLYALGKWKIPGPCRDWNHDSSVVQTTAYNLHRHSPISNILCALKFTQHIFSSRTKRTSFNAPRTLQLDPYCHMQRCFKNYFRYVILKAGMSDYLEAAEVHFKVFRNV
jgi:hypothetical protein